MAQFIWAALFHVIKGVFAAQYCYPHFEMEQLRKQPVEDVGIAHIQAQIRGLTKHYASDIYNAPQMTC